MSTEALIEKIRTGNVSEDAQVAADGQDDFVPILEHPVLREKAKAAFSAAHALAAKRLEQRRKQTRATMTVVAAAVLLGVVIAGGTFGYRHVQRQRQEALIKKRLAEAAAVAAKAAEDKKRAEAMALQQADANDVEIDLELLPLVKLSSPKPKGGKKGRVGQMVDEGPQGCQLDQAVIAGTIRGAFPQIKQCVRDQMARNDHLPEAITLSFVIANSGSVASFETDDRHVRSGPFFECLKRAMMGLHFKKFDGERCNVDYPITLGRKK